MALCRRVRKGAVSLGITAPGKRSISPSGLAAANEVERELTFLGLVGMKLDPPRPGVREAVERCTRAGIRAVMIAGNHKLTATAIAKQVGLWAEGDVAITGNELAALSDAELTRRSMSLRVFARTTAEQKLRIVRAFKARGHIVAMTGDGVNDAPALREAHIGVAMGRSGTDVARQAVRLGAGRRQLRDHRRGRGRGAGHLSQHPKVHLLSPLVEHGPSRGRLRRLADPPLAPPSRHS